MRSDLRPAEPLFRVSLAEWSLHRAVRNGALDHLDFPTVARRDYGIEAVEYVSTLFKQRDDTYLNVVRRRAEDAGVRSLLIMVDGEGRIGDPDPTLRTTAIANHARWVTAAALLGCHSIRINAESEGSPDEQRKLVADGLRRLCEIADRRSINVIVENHGGLSSDADWLTGVIRATGHPRAGTLPDFGNFSVSSEAGEVRTFDRYDGVKKMMPFARGVSAKSTGFDAAGNETTTDFERMLRIVVDAGYHGHVGVEYEGEGVSEPEGIRMTKSLLDRVREKLSAGQMAGA